MWSFWGACGIEQDQTAMAGAKCARQRETGLWKGRQQRSLSHLRVRLYFLCSFCAWSSEWVVQQAAAATPAQQDKDAWSLSLQPSPASVRRQDREPGVRRRRREDGDATSGTRLKRAKPSQAERRGEDAERVREERGGLSGRGVCLSVCAASLARWCGWSSSEQSSPGEDGRDGRGRYGDGVSG